MFQSQPVKATQHKRYWSTQPRSSAAWPTSGRKPDINEIKCKQVICMPDVRKQNLQSMLKTALIFQFDHHSAWHATTLQWSRSPYALSSTWQNFFSPVIFLFSVHFLPKYFLPFFFLITVTPMLWGSWLKLRSAAGSIQKPVMEKGTCLLTKVNMVSKA